MMNEPPVRRSHATAWILITLVAVPVLYLSGYPWVWWGWTYFVGPTPEWLFNLGNPWTWMVNHSGLETYLGSYWWWSDSVCEGLHRWMHPS